MGNDSKLHVGAYALVELSQKTVITQETFCPKDFSVYKNDNTAPTYCPICGTKTEKREVKSKHWPWFYDLFPDDIPLAAATIPDQREGEMFLIGNEHNDQTSYADINDGGLIEMTNGCSETLFMENFARRYYNTIQRLRASPLVKSVTVRFGVLFWSVF